jgi:antitoxin ParD1/3/4
MTTITISLPESPKTFVDTQLATKGYGNVSEYFRSLLREAQAKEQEARLEALLLEGLASRSIPLTEDFWNGIEAKTAEIIKKMPEARFLGEIVHSVVGRGRYTASN